LRKSGVNLDLSNYWSDYILCYKILYEKIKWNMSCFRNSKIYFKKCQM